VVSSTNKIGIDLLFVAFSKSLIHIRKSGGPKVEPCGMPFLTSAQLEKENVYVSFSYSDTV